VTLNIRASALLLFKFIQCLFKALPDIAPAPDRDDCRYVSSVNLLGAGAGLRFSAVIHCPSRKRARSTAGISGTLSVLPSITSHFGLGFQNFGACSGRQPALNTDVYSYPMDGRFTDTRRNA